MASPLQGMEYKVVKDYGNGSMIILPVTKFDAPDRRQLVFVRNGELLGRPVTLENGEEPASLREGIKALEALVQEKGW